MLHYKIGLRDYFYCILKMSTIFLTFHTLGTYEYMYAQFIVLVSYAWLAGCLVELVKVPGLVIIRCKTL